MGRLIWWAALLVIAVVTIGLQLDKQSEANPSLAPLVPAALRNFAQTNIVAGALDGNDSALALAEARKLVRQRPVPAEYLTLLAVAQTKAGQGEAAALTIQIAGQRGWRDPLAQESVLRLALAAGDKAEAARRYAALFLSDSTPDALLEELGPTVLDEPGGPGQQTMVTIVSGTERWRSVFLRRGVQVMPPAAFTAIVSATMTTGAGYDCAALTQVQRGLTRRDVAAGQQLADAAGACSKQRP